MSWAKEYTLFGWANITVFVLWCLVGVIGISMIILLSIGGGEAINWYLSILFVLLSVFKLFFSRSVVWSNRYKMLAKTYGVSEWTRTTEFADEEIILTDHTSVTKLKYENIKKIKEKGDLILIFLNNNLVIRLYKDAFVEGSWEECKEKIKSMAK